MKKYLFFALAIFLLACNEEEDPTCTHDMKPFMFHGADFTSDTIIYLADSIRFADELTQSVSFDSRWNGLPALTYNVNAKSSAINIRLEMEPTYNNGEVHVTCGTRQLGTIRFEHPEFPARNWDGYQLSFQKTTKIGSKTYDDILIFDASNVTDGPCNFSKFYYSANDGLIKVVSKQGISLNRISEKEFNDMTKKAAEERAKADSIEQAVADSIAQAVADSIEQAVIDSIAQAMADSIVSANQEDSSSKEEDLEELIENVTDCVKKAYSSGKLSALKDCEI